MELVLGRDPLTPDPPLDIHSDGATLYLDFSLDLEAMQAGFGEAIELSGQRSGDLVNWEDVALEDLGGETFRVRLTLGENE